LAGLSANFTAGGNPAIDCSIPSGKEGGMRGEGVEILLVAPC